MVEESTDPVLSSVWIQELLSISVEIWDEDPLVGREALTELVA